MGIVDRGSREERHPRSQWPAGRHWRGRSRIPETPPRVRPAPPTATYLIMAACIAVFAYGRLLGASAESELIRDFAFIPAEFQRGGVKGYVGLLTHMFLHGGWVHLIVNMVVFWSFGRGLEPAMGSIRFVILYLVSGVAAALGHAVLNGFPYAPLIGASGAIAGVVGAAAIAAPRMPVLFVIFPMPLWIAVIVLVALHIAAIVFKWEPDIAWYAHLVGLAIGALLYPLLRRRPLA